jgi:hypothetical protein
VGAIVKRSEGCEDGEDRGGDVEGVVVGVEFCSCVRGLREGAGALRSNESTVTAWPSQEAKREAFETAWKGQGGGLEVTEDFVADGDVDFSGADGDDAPDHRSHGRLAGDKPNVTDLDRDLVRKLHLKQRNLELIFILLAT